MGCDIIIPIWNQPVYTKNCIESIIRNTKHPYRLILIDNASSEETKNYLEGLTKRPHLDVKLIRNENNLGFVKAVNQGLKESDAAYVCIFNNDTITAPGWLERMVEFAEGHEDVGLMNPLCNGHGDIPIDEYAATLANNKGIYMEMNQCFGFCMLVKREVIEKIGYLDERFGMGCFDDTDYSMRAGRAGYRCVCVYSAYVYHVEKVSFKALGNRKGIVEECEKEFFKKWSRHYRIGVSFSLCNQTRSSEIENMLKAVLFLARQWCWINLWIFGKKDENMKKIKSASQAIAIPLHQNIKHNYLSDNFRRIQLLIRLIERSFGTKRRKKYDVIFVNSDRDANFLRISQPLHKTKILSVPYNAETIQDIWKKHIAT